MRWLIKIRKHHYLFIIIEAGILLLLLLLFPRSSHGQERNFIHGIVYDKDSDRPLSGTHILVNGTSYGTISGPDGHFRISVSTFPVKLKASHIGYEERLYVVDRKHRYDTLMLGMQFKAEILESVTITDKKVETLFRDESYSVLDFEFHENGLVLLIFRNSLNRADLLLLSFMNDTLATLHGLPGRAESLHRDCLDYIHYCTRDTAYQIMFNGTRLRLLYPVSMDFFKPVADAFVAFSDGYYYFAVKRLYEQLIDYIRYDSVSGTYTSFRRISDPQMLRILKENPMHHKLLLDPFSDAQEFEMLLGSASAEEQEAMRKQERDLSVEGHYLRTIVYTPVYAPLFINGNDLIIFNHPESVIEFLDHYGKLEYTTPVHYHEDNDWDELILKDDIRNEYYAVFNKMNRLTIQGIDINNGDEGPSTTLHFPYVKKVLVRNGYAYFTYRTPGTIERTMLFRQKLDQQEFKTALSH